MMETTYKTLEELPMFFNVATLSKVLGISQSSGYELIHEEKFPAIKIGSRIIVPKDKFIVWLEEKMMQ